MAAHTLLSREERIGLLVAGTAHVALVAALLLHKGEVTPYVPPERITVSLATDVALDSTAPNPSDNPAASIAPELAPVPEQAAPAEAVAIPQPAPTATLRPAPAPTPTATRRPSPTPTATRRPAPTPTASRRPSPTPSATRRPSPAPSASRAPSPAPSASRRPTPAPSATATRSGGSRVGADFLEGVSDADGDRGQAAQVASPAARASIAQALDRQLRPHWNPPSGVDVERLVTVVSFRLNRDGSLAGSPRVVRTDGVNDSNRAQMARHQEQAVRAVRLAAPFDLPERFYSAWQTVEWNFDNRLAQ